MKTRQILLLSLAVVAGPGSLLALGLRAPDQDAFAVARGNAFVATADNPSALYYNPAGITQLEGMNFRAGVYGIGICDQFRSAYGPSYDCNTESDLGFLPQIYSTLPIKGTPLTLGMGSYSPYGLSLEWPEDVIFKGYAQRGSLLYITFNPVLAWEITKTLSIGAGPTFNYSQVMLARYVPAEFKFKGDGFAFGASAGLLWKPHPKHALGVSYRSPTTLDYGGHTTLAAYSVPGEAEFRFPQNVIAGWSFRPTPKWNLEFDMDWTDWDYLKTVTLHNTVPPPLAPYIPAAVPLNFNWQSSFMFEWGVTHYFDNGLRVSAGYIYSQNSVPDEAFNPTVPDSDRHVFSVGLGGTHKRFSWDLAYQFGYGPARTVSFAGAPTPLHPEPTANGRYTFYSHAINLSFGYAF